MGKYCDNREGLWWWKRTVMMAGGCYDGKGLWWWKSTKTCIGEQKHRQPLNALEVIRIISSFFMEKIPHLLKARNAHKRIKTITVLNMHKKHLRGRNLLVCLDAFWHLN